MQDFPFTCKNGTPAGGSSRDENSREDCASCNRHYTLYTINDTDRKECAPDTFGMLSNGITIICPGVKTGDTFKIDSKGVSTTYTKRRKNDITANNAALTCTTGITNMSRVFRATPAFNQDIGHWDVSKVSDMNSMFNAAAAFNQDISHWDVSKVHDMSFMFARASAFNQDIGRWDISEVENMRFMFAATQEFNKDIGRWNVRRVTNMTGLFRGASKFNQNISKWCVHDIKSEPSEFDDNSALEDDHAPVWGTCPL